MQYLRLSNFVFYRFHQPIPIDNDEDVVSGRKKKKGENQSLINEIPISSGDFAYFFSTSSRYFLGRKKHCSPRKMHNNRKNSSHLLLSLAVADDVDVVEMRTSSKEKLK